MFGFKSRAAKTRETAIGLLRRSEQTFLLGVFAYLHRTTGQDDFWCAAIINGITGLAPANQEAQEFLAQNQMMIEHALCELSRDEVVAKAVSYFYAARILEAVFATGQPVSPETADIAERATKFGFYIPNTYDICGTGDAADCTLAINAYAREFGKAQGLLE